MYQRPYTKEEILKKYPKEISEKLFNDKVHLWRAETGLELIHKEPTIDELERIWKNWQEMSEEEKEISDKKSLEIFGTTNEKHYFNILRKQKYKNFFSLIIIGFIILSIRFFSGNEDSWICNNGEWIKHGNPKGDTPLGKCGKLVATTTVEKIYITKCGEYDKKEIKIGGVNIFTDIADNNCKRELGLSGRSELLNNEAMFFVFEKPGYYGFWMKDMKFSIDIFWINEDFSVSGIVDNFSPEDYPKVLGNNYLAKYVLEVPTGFAEKNNIKIGDSIEFVN